METEAHMADRLLGAGAYARGWRVARYSGGYVYTHERWPDPGVFWTSRAAARASWQWGFGRALPTAPSLGGAIR